MNKSGFNTIFSISPKGPGRLRYSDRFGRIDKGLKSLAGTDNILFFTTLKANTVTTISSDGIEYVSRWDPVGYDGQSGNLHFTQSSIANMPAISTQWAYNGTNGKGFGIRGITDDFLEQAEAEPSASFSKQLMIAWTPLTGSPAASRDAIFSHAWAPNYDPYKGGFKLSSLTSSFASQSFDITATQTDGVTIKSATMFCRGTDALLNPVAYGALGYTSLRTYRYRINSTLRTGSVEVGLGNSVPFIAFSAGGTLISRTGSTGASPGFASNTTTFAFSTASMSASAVSSAEWDSMFGNGYQASKIGLFKNTADSVIHTILYTPTILSDVNNTSVSFEIIRLHGVR